MENNLLLTDAEMIAAFAEAHLSPFANAYQERCVIARAQLSKVLAAGYLPPEEVKAKVEEGRKQEREGILRFMSMRDVGGKYPEWALSDKDYQALRREK